MHPRLSVVVPCYNERTTIEPILERIRAVEIEKEIIIVDDGSTDGTRELLLEIATRSAADIRIFLQPENCGKGAAVRRGFAEARGSIVLVQDADLELDPQDYFKLLEPIEQGRSDVVYGARFLMGRPRAGKLLHYVGNRLLTRLSNLLTGLNLNDVWTCYKAMRREVLPSLDLRENGFGIEPEITAGLARSGWRISEAPVHYSPRRSAEGKKIRLRDGFAGVLTTIRTRKRNNGAYGINETNGSV
ncbi:MAG: glycosyltransferase family 2 protein [Acidobacteria bacterium]|nr:glycosyltransferase family 2 protein [Acidobacteriota bacterium]